MSSSRKGLLHFQREKGVIEDLPRIDRAAIQGFSSDLMNCAVSYRQSALKQARGTQKSNYVHLVDLGNSLDHHTQAIHPQEVRLFEMVLHQSTL